MSGGNTFNAVAGAVLASVLGVMGIGLGAESLFHAHYPEKAGFAPDAVFDSGGGGPAAPVGPPDFGVVFADAARFAELVARGEKAVGQCGACHTFDAGGANKTGPNLHDVFGRRAASHGGFTYSAAMQGHNVTWSYMTLNDFLQAPSTTVRGTAMQFGGMRRPEDRMAVIAYLRSISPHDMPLPAPLPQPEATGGAAPATGQGESVPAGQQPNPPTQPDAAKAKSGH